MKRVFLGAIGALLLGLTASAQAIFATASLDSAQEVPAGVSTSTATGQAKLNYDIATSTLDFSLVVDGISLADITFPGGGLAFGAAGPVHIHNAVAGANGGIVVPFPSMADYTATATGFALEATGIDLSGCRFRCAL